MNLFMQKWVSIMGNGLIRGKWLSLGGKWYLLCKIAHWEKYLIIGQKKASYNARWLISWQSSCLPGSFPQDPASVAADETKETRKFLSGSAQPLPHWHYWQISEWENISFLDLGVNKLKLTIQQNPGISTYPLLLQHFGHHVRLEASGHLWGFHWNSHRGHRDGKPGLRSQWWLPSHPGWWW